MKIVSWNISESKPWKVDHLMGLNADVLVAPEITCPEKACISDSYDIKWYGIEYFFHEKKWKELGIIWKKGNGIVPEWFNPQLEYAIPLIIKDCLIFSDSNSIELELLSGLVADYSEEHFSIS